MDNIGLEVFKKFKVLNIFIVFIFIFGWLLWVNLEINVFDVFIVVWLFGFEGGGIVDVIMCNE